MTVITVAVFTVCQLFWNPISVLSSPVRNTTALRTEIAPAWVATPQGRGTWDLLYSCTFTLTLCIWTAIHLNVPPKEKRRYFWRRKIKWVALALFMPEFVLFSAWEQRHSAATLVEMFPNAVREGMAKIAENKSSGGKPKDGEAEKKEARKKISMSGNEEIAEVEDERPKLASEERVTEVGEVTLQPEGKKLETMRHPTLNMVQAFYIVMGGLTLDIRDPLSGRRTLTPMGLLYFARRGHFFDISEDTVRDKSKADILAKGLVCCQVTWVVIQCIARKAAGLPVTLLEVHTMVHVVCALSMYALWFRKPLDVKYPSIDYSMSFRLESQKLLRITKYGIAAFADFGGVEGADARGFSLGMWEDCIIWRRSRNVFLWSEGHTGFGGMGRRVGWNLPTIQGVLLLVVASLSAAYGAVHAAAWKFLFPSPTEHLLWKISCIVCIAGSLPASIAVMAISDVLSETMKPLERPRILWRDWGAGNPVKALLFMICGITLPVFIAARLFMVAEAFLSLRHTAIGSYATVQWASYIPHF